MKSDEVHRRETAIERLALLELPEARELRALAALAANVCGASTATITVVTGTQQHHLTDVGFPPPGAVDVRLLPEAVVGDPDVVVVGDVRRDDRFPGGQADSGWLFHASAPLSGPDGVVIGRLTVLDAHPRELDSTQVEVLEVLAERVMGVSELAVCARELEGTRRELADAREELQRSREHLSLFAGQVSHDLRTPLTAIGANAEMLSTEPVVTGDPDLTWMVDGVGRAAQRMNAMIEQMLDYAREGGSPVRGSTDLTSVFELALADLSPAVAESGAEITLRPLPTLEADADQMYAVALNLLSNALRFSRPETEPRVVVAADLLDDRWRVTVTDNGIGVAPDKQETMFVLFARADKRTGGSGIGLAMTRRIIEAHGGRTGMQAAPGGGTTVWFELPA